jgi:hypothetical protein
MMISKKLGGRLIEKISLKIDIHLLAKNIKLMSQISEIYDDLQPEYDFTQLTIVDRGKGRKKSSITPAQWNKIASNNPSFAFLHDSEEDIYTLEDGIAVSYEE